MVEKREVEYSKELDVVASLLVDVIAIIKTKVAAGETVGAIAAALAAAEFSHLIQAVAAISEVDDNVVENRKVAMQTIGYRLGELVDALV